MRKPAAYLFAILVGAIIWFFFQHFKVEGTNTLRVVPKTEEELNRVADQGAANIEGSPAAEDSNESAPGGLRGFFSRLGSNKPETADDSTTSPVNLNTDTKSYRDPGTIRIASFQLNYFGSSNDDPIVKKTLVEVVKNFDVISLQGISPQGTTAVVELARSIGGYDAVLPRSLGLQGQDQIFAYLYNTETIVADRGDGLYTLIDHDNLLRRDPLIGWFRAKAAPANEAFTFSLVSVHASQRHAAQELDVFDDAMNVIRHDRRNEDDVIMLGCFQASHQQLRGLGAMRGLVATIRKPPTSLDGKRQTQNIVFQQPETDEWTGMAKVFDYFRAYDLDSGQAALISDHLPIWAEFSIYEGGRRDTIARATDRRY